MVALGHFLDDFTYFNHYYIGRKTAHLFRSIASGKLIHGIVQKDIYALGSFRVPTSIPENNVLVNYIFFQQKYASRKMILESNTLNKVLGDLVSSTESSNNPVLIFYKL
ncbi:hypothetical protein GCM10007049_25970 [Echinicola pacifica]|uniref:Uncharacterized protein n=1 Tax=Echinicola pacifica TaxID=346377 RepID=A0A918Q2I2_9BACT|nr:hypothetical protein GCM10007049_25970 [Echinicola pacifica]